MTKPGRPWNGDPGLPYGAQLTSALCFSWAGSVARTVSATSFAGASSGISCSYPWPHEKSWNSAVSVSAVASMGHEPPGGQAFTVAL